MEIKYIYNHLEDEWSKKIFSSRYMYYITSDSYFLREIVLTVPECKKIYDLLRRSQKRKFIFGAGIWGAGILKTFDNIEFAGFIDNFRDQKRLYEFEGKQVFSFEEYMELFRDDLVVISSRVYNRQIFQQLIKNGISEENILNIGEINDNLNKRQYFDLPQLKEKISPKECFVDAGCLDGRSSICFQKWCKGAYRKIYAIEPDAYNRELCNKEFLSHKVTNYEIISKGLWSEKTNLEFEENQNGLSRLVDSQGSTRISVDCLDDIVDGEVTFIKMDIEGAEYNALLGSRKIITEQKPKLAISIYHKPKDIVEILSLILTFNNKYKFYIRHYSTSWNETILYAI